MIYPEMTSEQLKGFQTSMDGLKRRLNIEHVPSTILVNDCLNIVKKAVGVSGLLKELLEEIRINKGDFTPEEIAEQEAVEQAMEEQAADERARLIGDYKPFFNEAHWKDLRNLSIALVRAAEDSEESFDVEFEAILMNRYNKRIVQTEAGKMVVYGKKL